MPEKGVHIVSILDFIGAKGDGSVVTTGAIKHAKLQSKMTWPTSQHPVFTDRMPFLSPNQHCQSTDNNPVWQKSQQLSCTMYWYCATSRTVGEQSVMQWGDMTVACLPRHLTNCVWLRILPEQCTKATVHLHPIICDMLAACDRPSNGALTMPALQEGWCGEINTTSTGQANHRPRTCWC